MLFLVITVRAEGRVRSIPTTSTASTCITRENNITSANTIQHYTTPHPQPSYSDSSLLPEVRDVRSQRYIPVHTTSRYVPVHTSSRYVPVRTILGVYRYVPVPGMYWYVPDIGMYQYIPPHVQHPLHEPLNLSSLSVDVVP